MNRSWAIINLIQLEHNFWSLSVLKTLPQLSLTSIIFALLDRELSNDTVNKESNTCTLCFGLNSMKKCVNFCKNWICFWSSSIPSPSTLHQKRMSILLFLSFGIMLDKSTKYLCGSFWISLVYLRLGNYITIRKKNFKYKKKHHFQHFWM